MIDRRFINLKLAVEGFASSIPSVSSSDGVTKQWIVSAPWGNDYPLAKKNSLAIYNVKKDAWEFINPNNYATSEVINLETGEILTYKYTSSGYSTINEWSVIGTIGMLKYPYVVDEAITSDERIAQVSKISGFSYIRPGVDNYVYFVSGENNISTYDIDLEKKVAVINSGRTYQVVQSEGNTFFETDYEYIPANTLIKATKTQNIYVSGIYTNNKLTSLLPSLTSTGENLGNICIEKHVFTEEEISNRQLYLNNKVAKDWEYTCLCIYGSAVLVSSNIDNNYASFSCYSSQGQVGQIYWNYSDYLWYSNPPRVDDVAIFIYMKE